jgi:hypothetical protein
MVKQGPKDQQQGGVPLLPLWSSRSLDKQVYRVEWGVAGSAPHDPPRRRRRGEHRPRGGTPTVERGAGAGGSSPRQSSVSQLVLNRHKSRKYLKGVNTLARGIRINCNLGAVTTNPKGTYGKLQVWYLPEGIANIFSMHELEKTYCITYKSWDRYYAVHTPRGEVLFYKDEQLLPYIDL